MITTTPDLVESLYERWGAAFAAEPEMPLDRWRAMIEEWPQVTAEPGGVDHVEVEAGGVPAMWITPKGAAADRVILSIHGGGFVVGSMYTHRKLFGHIAKAAGTRSLAPDYRRPPEHLHPAPVEDVVSTYTWLLDEGIEPAHVAFTGDSAGGAMVVTAMLLARDRGLPLPAASMPFSAWFDLTGSGESQQTNAETDKLLSEKFGNRLADILLHTFQMAAGRSPVADDAIRRLAGWVRPHLGL